MGRRRLEHKSQTLPPSPSHSFSSSSSSDFEFTVSLSPRKSSTALCRPADELFYKGQLLPLHLSPRLSMVRTLLLLPSSSSSNSSSSCSASDTTASRDSTGSSNDSHSSFGSDLVLLADHSCDSSRRPSSVAEEVDEFKRGAGSTITNDDVVLGPLNSQIKKNKYFSLSRFSSVFKKDPKHRDPVPGSNNSVKRMSTTAKEVIRKYMKKVKPLYEKLSQKQQQQKMGGSMTSVPSSIPTTTDQLRTQKSSDQILLSGKTARRPKESGSNNNGGFSHSFSGNLRYPRRRSCVSSCPSSMRCSPSHSGVLCRTGTGSTGSTAGKTGGAGGILSYADRSSMEELQSAIQGAIAHCKNSHLPVQSKTMVSNEI